MISNVTRGSYSRDISNGTTGSNSHDIKCNYRITVVISSHYTIIVLISNVTKGLKMCDIKCHYRITVIISNAIKGINLHDLNVITGT